MKKKKIVIIILSLLLTLSCKNGASDNINPKTVVMPEISENFITNISEINHIDNKAEVQNKLYLFFDQAELKKIYDLHISNNFIITPKIISEHGNIEIEPKQLKLKIDDLYQKPYFNLTVKTGALGKYKVSFLANIETKKEIEQKTEALFSVSHREIKTFIADAPIYRIQEPATASLEVSSTDPDDNFIVAIDGNNVEQETLTKHCEFSKDFHPACKIQFTPINPNVTIKATLETDQPVSKTISPYICQYNENTLYIKENSEPNIIGFNTPLTLQIGRCTTSVEFENILQGSVSFYSFQKPEEEISNIVKTILGIEARNPRDSFSFAPKQELISINLTPIDSSKQDAFKFDLPEKFTIRANAAQYTTSTKIAITNEDHNTPNVTIKSKLSVYQNKSTIVGFERNNISDNTKISFKLFNETTKSDVAQDEYSLQENIPLQTLSLNLNSEHMITVGSHYTLHAYLNNDTSKEITISGDTQVEVLAPKPIKFAISPNKKHILQDLNQQPFYLALDNIKTSINRGKSNKLLDSNTKLYIYSDHNSEDHGCDGILFYNIDNNHPEQIGNDCKLASREVISDDSKLCTCTTNSNGFLDQKCVFKAVTPNSYQGHCNINFRTKEDLEQAIASNISSVKGLSDIHIKMQQGGDEHIFPYSGMLRLYFDGKNYLNDHWFIKPSTTNINDGTLFQDGLMFDMREEYFAPGNQTDNDFIIKNYPGKNLEDATITLPYINFTLGWKIGDVIRWSTADNCPDVPDLLGFYPPNLGCTRGGGSQYNTYHYKDKYASFPAGKISVNKSGITVNNSGLDISNGWFHRPSDRMAEILTTNFYKQDNQTICVDITAR